MPYVDQEVRHEVDAAIDALIERVKHKNGGVLNYALNRLVAGWLLGQPRGAAARGNVIGYGLRAEAFGHFQAAVQEFQRRVLDPYEIQKQQTAGDVAEFATLDHRR